MEPAPKAPPAPPPPVAPEPPPSPKAVEEAPEAVAPKAPKAEAPQPSLARKIFERTQENEDGKEAEAELRSEARACGPILFDEHDGKWMKRHISSYSGAKAWVKCRSEGAKYHRFPSRSH